jgi:hypothetical protein
MELNRIEYTLQVTRPVRCFSCVGDMAEFSFHRTIRAHSANIRLPH